MWSVAPDGKSVLLSAQLAEHSSQRARARHLKQRPPSHQGFLSAFDWICPEWALSVSEQELTEASENLHLQPMVSGDC